jgi:ketopantoate reductase
MPKENVLLVGGGGVGTIASLNITLGGLANVTMVLRSNYEAVREHGYRIKSCDHPEVTHWRCHSGQ